MLGTPSLVRDDRINVEKRCLELFCFDENFARAACVFSQKREKREKRAGAKYLCGVFASTEIKINDKDDGKINGPPCINHL